MEGKMQLQETLIKKYRKIYPNYPFRKISEQTGIQQTRLFRIFNGQEMKLSEYETFRSILAKNGNYASFDFNNHITKNLKQLTPEQLENIDNEIQYLVQLNETKKVLPFHRARLSSF